MDRTFLQSILDKCQAAGIEQASSFLLEGNKQEFNVDNGEIKLLRTVKNLTLEIVGLTQHKRASVTLNQLGEEAVDQAIADLKSQVDAAEADEAWELEPAVENPAQSFGPLTPDLERMYALLDSFNQLIQTDYPTVKAEQVIIEHNRTEKQFLNTNGLFLNESQGWYFQEVVVAAKDDQGSSSFNYTFATSHHLNHPLIEWGAARQLLNDIIQQTQCVPVGEPFVGPVILSPEAAGDLVEYLVEQIVDWRMIDGSSIYKDKLNQRVAAPCLNIELDAGNTELPDIPTFSRSGRIMHPSTLVEDGVLNHFLLSRYGANKTGQDISPNDGSVLSVEAGSVQLQEMIASIDKGLLINRISGGEPARNGDFSAVAKNSFLIENGAVTRPIAETMFAGNVAQMLMDISAISSERRDFGNSKLPWIQVEGLSVS